MCFLSLRWAHSLNSDAAQPPHVRRLLFLHWWFRGRILTSHPATFSHYCQSWNSAAHLLLCLVIPACVCVCVSSRFSRSFSYFRRRMKPHLSHPFISESFLNPPGTGWGHQVWGPMHLSSKAGTTHLSSCLSVALCGIWRGMRPSSLCVAYVMFGKYLMDR